jgi:hypothetical protein
MARELLARIGSPDCPFVQVACLVIGAGHDVSHNCFSLTYAAAQFPTTQNGAWVKKDGAVDRAGAKGATERHLGRVG